MSCASPITSRQLSASWPKPASRDPAHEGQVTHEEGSRSPAAPFSIAAAAELLGISKRTVERRISDGSIRVLRLGRVVRIPVSELHRLIDGNGETQPQKDEA